jgi:F0F1-type ATP synthase membrane subunit c/vacuolar-type H+-ATPase subunit K
MPIKRAIWISVVAYVATFLVGVLLGLFLGIDAVSPETMSPMFLYTAMATTLVIMGATAWWFFLSSDAVANYKNGLLFGLVSFGVGFALDFVSALPFGNPIDILGPYYSQPLFFVMLALILATTTGVGYWLGTGTRESNESV